LASLPIYVLNGPNLNLLGQREPEIYGRTSLAEIGQMTAERAKGRGFSVDFRQSNHEGVLVDWIQEAREKACGVIINGGAYSHTSLALHDALRALDKPVVEVHLSNPFAREAFRHHSRLSPVAKGVIVGFGAQSYVLAVEALISLLESAGP
jgi:3-dehydroquinate dehydratase-2